MATAPGYPTTVEGMYDRLIADRAFFTRTIVTDNYPAVRANFLALLQSGYPEKVDTPAKLVRELAWWDGNDPEAVDKVLSVPYRAAAGSAVLDQALAKGREVAEASGNPKFIGALVYGISTIINGAASAGNGRNRAESEARQLQLEIVAQVERENEARKSKEKLVKTGLIIGGIVLLIVAIIIARRK